MSLALPLLVGIDSSRKGRTFRSAYFLQFVPQLSQRILVARPLGALHHMPDSRVLHAPHVGTLEVGWLIIDSSSSERPTCCATPVSSNVGYCRAVGMLGTPCSVILLFSSPSLALLKDRQLLIKQVNQRYKSLLPVSVIANDFGHGPCSYFFSDSPEFGSMR